MASSFLSTSLSGAKKVLIGMDIGSSYIKGVALEQNKKELSLIKIAQKELPKNAITDKDVTDQESVIFTIQNLMEELDPKAQDIVIAVSGNKVFSDKVTVKKQNKPAAQREQVMIQAEERIPMGTDGVSIGFFPITDNEQGKPIDVELIAARTDFIRSYVELVHDAGYTVTAVDVDGLALFNSFEHNYEISPDAVLCLMNIGHSITNLVFVINGHFFSMRDISVGMQTIWETIQGELAFGTDDMANLYKGFYEAVDPTRLNDAVETATADLKVSLDTAFTYLETITQGQTVDKIYISGGGALVPNLPEAISLQMNLDCEVVNPFTNIVFDPTLFVEKPPEEVGAIYTVATGLALRAE